MLIVVAFGVSPCASAQPVGAVPTVDELVGVWYVQAWAGAYLNEDETYLLCIAAGDRGELVVGYGTDPEEGAIVAVNAPWDAEAGVFTMQHDVAGFGAVGAVHVACRLREGVLFLAAEYEDDASTPGECRLTRAPLDNGSTRRGRQASNATMGDLRSAAYHARYLYESALLYALDHDDTVPTGLGVMLHEQDEEDQAERARERRRPGGLGGGLGGRGGGLGGRPLGAPEEEAGPLEVERPDAYDAATAHWLMRKRPRGFRTWGVERRIEWVDENADFVLLIAGQALGEDYPRLRGDDPVQRRRTRSRSRDVPGGRGLGRPGGRPAPGGLNLPPERGPGGHLPQDREQEEREAEERARRLEARQAAWAQRVVLFELPRTRRQRTVSLCFGDGRVARVPLREADALLREQTGTDLAGWMDHLEREVVPDSALEPRPATDAAEPAQPDRPDRPGRVGGVPVPREHPPHVVDVDHPANGDGRAAQAQRAYSQLRLERLIGNLPHYLQDNKDRPPNTLGELTTYLSGPMDPPLCFLPWQTPGDEQQWDDVDDADRPAWVDERTGYGYVGAARITDVLDRPQDFTGREVAFFELPLYAGVETVGLGMLGGRTTRLAYDEADALLLEQTGLALMDWMDVYGYEQQPAQAAGPTQQEDNDD
ncbi:hypothetical protein OT109_15115 [Phycisphaeraceae bacterium D3-23]